MSQKKIKKSLEGPDRPRRRVRKPAVVAEFVRRLRNLIADAGCQQGELAAALNCRIETVSRLTRGLAASLPIDLMVSLAEWADARGYDLRWLVMGVAEMRKGSPAVTPGLAAAYREALTSAMLLVIARRAGIDLAGVLEEWTVDLDIPDKGVVTAPLAGLVEKIEGRSARQDEGGAARPPYLTVGPEDVPTDPDWWMRFVPVIGRVAAGIGIDADEASAYPPAWAGEFLAYEGAPQSAVAVRVVGTSMEPLYGAGDMVVVDPARRAENGQVCCVLLAIDDRREVRLKRLRIQGGQAILESLNPAHPAIRLPAGQVAGAYRIIDHLRGHRPAE